MAEQVKKYKDWKTKRAAELQVDKDPSQWVWFDSYPGYEDWYHLGNAKAVARAAKTRGLPPALGIAAAMDESGLANTGGLNLMRVNLDAHPQAREDVNRIQDEYAGRIIEAVEKPMYEDAGDVMIGNRTGPTGPERQAYIDQLVSARQDAEAQYLLDYGMNYLSKQINQSGLNTTGLQNYSGKGSKVGYGGKDARFFGKKNKSLNLRKTQDQGRRKESLWKAIEAHPGFQPAWKDE